MKKVEVNPVLKLHFGELAERESENSWRIVDLGRAFSGEVRGGEYTIPAADGVGDLNFDNLEVLRRFCIFSVNHQKTFLVALRRVMEQHSVEVAILEVGWARNRTRKLQVRSFGEGVHLAIMASM